MVKSEIETEAEIEIEDGFSKGLVEHLKEGHSIW